MEILHFVQDDTILSFQDDTIVSFQDEDVYFKPCV